MYRRGEELAVAAADAGIPVAGVLRDAHRDIELAVRRGLDARREPSELWIGIFEDNGIMTVYISTLAGVDEQAQTDLRRAVRAALSPYYGLSHFTGVIFLERSAAPERRLPNSGAGAHAQTRGDRDKEASCEAVSPPTAA